MSQRVLEFGETKLPLVKVHPSVIFEILNCFARRDEKQNRVIGSLLGFYKDNYVEITECFMVPHHERTDEVYVAIKKDYHVNMLNYRKLINSHEVLVGWFSTVDCSRSDFVSDNCSLIHEFYANECNNPIHLVVDTSLKAQHMNIKAYVSRPILVKTFALGNIFQELGVSVVTTSEAETLCLHQMIAGQKAGEQWSSPNTIVSVQNAVECYNQAKDRLKNTLNRAIAVLNEKSVSGHSELCEALFAATSVLQCAQKQSFTDNMQKKLERLEMINYLATLTKVQVAIAEKINAIL